MNIKFKIVGNKILINLKAGRRAIDQEDLTISQGFDIVLIRTLDKLFHRNKMDRLSLKNVEISGKTRPEAISGMILKTVAKALII